MIKLNKIIQIQSIFSLIIIAILFLGNFPVNLKAQGSTATIVASKIVCENESDLPNWHDSSTTVVITENTASDFVSGNSNCNFESNWQFQWAPREAINPGGSFLGEASSPWTTFPSSTNSQGQTSVTITVPDDNFVWIREVLKPDYITFSLEHGNPPPGSDVSAEMWCHTDIKKYDNNDFIKNIEEGNTYHCVAFNALTKTSLNVSINSGSGTITGPDIDCPGDCSETYPKNDWVSIIATPEEDYVFSSWSSGSACEGQTSICSILMDGNKTASANFNIAIPFNYSLSNSGTSEVTKTDGDAFTQNTITKTLVAGETESVAFSLSGVPTGTSYSISNSSCSPNCSSVITFTVTPSTPAGTYPITVTGSPLNKETSFNLIVSGNPAIVSCSVTPAIALLGDTVTWTANVEGGTPPFTYSWSGTDIPTSPAPATNPLYINYTTVGDKTAAVTVTDTDSVQGDCPTVTVKVKIDALYEEF